MLALLQLNQNVIIWNDSALYMHFEGKVLSQADKL